MKEKSSNRAKISAAAAGGIGVAKGKKPERKMKTREYEAGVSEGKGGEINQSAWLAKNRWQRN